jgi:hypothetical protein
LSKTRHRATILDPNRGEVNVAPSAPTADRDLLIEIYRAFNARDIETVLAHFHPDIDWPNGMEGGRVHGHEGVRAYWRRQWALIDPKVEPRAFRRDSAGRVVVSVHQLVRARSGAVLSERMVEHVYTIENALVRRMDIAE